MCMDNLKENEKDKDCTFLKMNQQVANHYYKISSINIFSDEILISLINIKFITKEKKQVNILISMSYNKYQLCTLIENGNFSFLANSSCK